MVTTDIVCGALREGRKLQLTYNGHQRIVEVHAVGTTTAGNNAMRVFQVSGGSDTGKVLDWRMLRLDEIYDVCLLDEISEAPRTGYKRKDKGLRRIILQI